MKKLYLKRVLVSILTFILIFNCVLIKPMQTKAVGTGVLAGYTMAEILALLGVAVSGTVFAVSATGGDGSVPDDFFVEMNARQSGVGDKLKQYCDIGKTLSQGDKLVISSGDFATLKNFFVANNATQFEGSFSSGNEITNAQLEGLKNEIQTFCPFTLPTVNSNFELMFSGKSSSFTAFVYHYRYGYEVRIYENGTFTWNFDTSNNHLIISSSSRWLSASTSSWVSSTGGLNLEIDRGSLSVNTLNGISISATQDGAISNVLVNDEYNVINPGRVMDNTGAISGDCVITLPVGSSLDNAISQGNVQSIYNYMNVIPVNTTSKTMVYYPDVSVVDYITQEKEVPTVVDFSPINNIIQGDNVNYTMNLSSFFPFCIPFDVVDFCRQFQATPQAPSITFPFPYVTNNGGVAFIEKTFDLSQFDAVAQLVRRLELIAFIVGLAFVTRNFFIRG